MWLTIVIPAYNEEKRLPRALTQIRDYLASTEGRGRKVEIVVVDDGSTDATAWVVEDWKQRLRGLRLISNGANRGKGCSVRRGALEARGEIVLFTDADLSAPIEESAKLITAVENGNDIAIGSRAIDRSLIDVHQSRGRELAGIVFNRCVRLLTGLQFRDTQCGFKAFKRESCRIVFAQQRIERFGFDPEILFIAKLRGLRAVEVPVRWAHDEATKVHVLRDSLRMFTDLIYIRWNYLMNRYPVKASRHIRFERSETLSCDEETRIVIERPGKACATGASDDGSAAKSLTVEV